LKSRVEQFYSDLLGLLITGDNKRTSRWEILHRKITRPWKGKLLGLGGSPSFRALITPRISRGHFFLTNFFRVTHDGLSEKETTRNLLAASPDVEYDQHVTLDCRRLHHNFSRSQDNVWVLRKLHSMLRKENNFNKSSLPHVAIALSWCLCVPGGGLEPFRRVIQLISTRSI